MKFCRKCGKEMADDSQFCSACGTKVEEENSIIATPLQANPEPTIPKEEKKSSKFKTSGCLGLILLIAFIAMVGSCMSSDSGKNSSQGSKQAQQNKAPVFDYSCDVGGVGKVKGMFSSKVGVAIAKIQDMGTIDAPFASRKAQGVFKVLYVVVSNNQKDAITADANSYKLIDEQGREFSHSVEGDMALQMSDRATLFLKQINPGLTLGGYIAYDVPKDAKIRGLQFSGGVTGEKKELPFKVIME